MGATAHDEHFRCAVGIDFGTTGSSVFMSYQRRTADLNLIRHDLQRVLDPPHQQDATFRIALLGAHQVGKSTFLNTLLGQALEAATVKATPFSFLDQPGLDRLS